MGEKKFSMGEAIGFGWETMKANIGFFIGLLIIVFIIQNVPSLLGDLTAKNLPVLSVLFYLGGLVVGLAVQLGLMKISIQFCDNIKGKLSDLFSTFHLIIKYFIATILYVLIVMVGMILLIIPGVIWTFKFMLYPYFIIDQGLGPIKALKASSQATDGAKWDLFVFGIVLALINLAGFLLVIVGLFATIPTTLVAFAYVFRTLSPETGVTQGVTQGPKGGVMYVDLGV